MNENNTNQEVEALETRRYIQNLIISYLIELNESRGELYLAMKFGKDSPSYIQEFLGNFRKFFDLFSRLVNEVNPDLKEQIETWFNNTDKFNEQKKKEGIDLSIKFQSILEDEGVFQLFEESITPPFMYELATGDHNKEYDKHGRRVKNTEV